MRRAAVVAGLALVALPVSAPAVMASPAAAELAPAACSAEEVSVVVDYNELGGETRVVCAATGGTGAQLFEDAGFGLSSANAPGMQGFVCTVSGLPKSGKCGQSTAYWSLWSSDGESGSGDWAYASLGVTQLELEPGDHVGFAWHEGGGKVQPPDLALPGSGQVEAKGGDEVVEGARAPVADDADDGGGTATWLLIGGAVVVIGAAGAVPLTRRRRGERGR